MVLLKAGDDFDCTKFDIYRSREREREREKERERRGRGKGRERKCIQEGSVKDIKDCVVSFALQAKRAFSTLDSDVTDVLLIL